MTVERYFFTTGTGLAEDLATTISDLRTFAAIVPRLVITSPPKARPQRGGRGRPPAPGNLSAISVDVELWSAVGHQVRRLTRWIAKDTGTTPPAPPTSADTAALLEHLAHLIPAVTNTQVLQAVLDDLVHATGLASDLVDGHTQTRLPDPCPHCENHTLLATIRTDEIRCDRDQAGHYQDCTCSTPGCPCTADPTHRHTWTRTGQGPTSWYALRDLITTRKEQP